MNILINGINSTSAGGAVIFRNFLDSLDSLASERDDIVYYVMATDAEYMQDLSSKNIRSIVVPKYFTKSFINLFTYMFLFRWIEKRYGIDAMLNFGDLIPSAKCRLIYYFDWAYLVYPKHGIWRSMSWQSYFARKIKFLQIHFSLRRCDAIIVQTNVIKNLIRDRYKIDNVHVLSNTINEEDECDSSEARFGLPSGVKFLYLSRYYPHKNIEVLVDVARLIKKNKDDFKIIVTLHTSHHNSVEIILNNIKKHGLEDIFINVGEVDRLQIPCLFSDIDFLLMPTTLESFSTTYLEAMRYKKPILTSDMDFAREVCGEAAVYFDPFSHVDIYNKMCGLARDRGAVVNLIEAGTLQLREFSNWHDISKKILMIATNRNY